MVRIQPDQVSLKPGETATFTATFSGSSPQTVTWTASGGGSVTGSASGTDPSAQFVAGTDPGTYTVTVAGLLPATHHGVQATATVHIVADAAGDAPAPPSNPTPPSDSTPPAQPGSSNTSTTPPPATPSSPSKRLFTSSAANWLYQAPTGPSLNISSMTSGLTFHVNTHDGGFDYPVQYTDGSHGCTSFNDRGHWGYNDQFCVPNPANGYWPSVGGWGANDGHLVVLNTATGNFYDFWKLYVNGAGQPTSTNVGQIVSGNVKTSAGSPGTTAAQISGLAGDILPGELDCITCLQHALSVIVPGSMNSPQLGHQAPVTHSDGSAGGGIFREGAKIRFDPSVDVSKLSASTAVKAILTALQNYGGLITDQTGGNGISFYSSITRPPDLTGINVIGSHLLIYY